MKKGFVLVIIFMAGLLFLSLTGGYFYLNRDSIWQKSKPTVAETKKDLEPAQDTTSNIPTKDSPAEIDIADRETIDKETADWQTAVNPFIGMLKISFKYPLGWHLNTAATDGDSCDAGSIAPTEDFFCGSANFSPIYIKPLTAGDGLRCKTGIKKTTVNQKSASWCTEIVSQDTKIFLYNLPKGTKIVDYFFEDIVGPSKLYTGIAVWYTEEPGKTSYQDEFGYVLATLQFLGCGPATSKAYC